MPRMELRFLSCPARSLVAIPTALSRLQWEMEIILKSGIQICLKSMNGLLKIGDWWGTLVPPAFLRGPRTRTFVYKLTFKPLIMNWFSGAGSPILWLLVSLQIFWIMHETKCWVGELPNLKSGLLGGQQICNSLSLLSFNPKKEHGTQHGTWKIVEDVTPCSLVQKYRGFEGTHCLHFPSSAIFRLSLLRISSNDLSDYTA
jgi:hypothetical protein